MKRVLCLWVLLLLAVPSVVHADAVHYDATFTGAPMTITYCDTCVMTGFTGPISGSLGYAAGQLTGMGYLNLTIGAQRFVLSLPYALSTWEAPSSWYVVGQTNIPEINAKAKLWLNANMADVGCVSFGCNGVLPSIITYPYGAWFEIRDMATPFDFDGMFYYSFHHDHYLNASLTLTPMPTTAAVPEPSTVVLIGLGFGVIVLRKRFMIG